MAFEKIKENTEELQDRAKEFIDANIAYYKLLGFKLATKSTSLLLKIFLLSVMLVIVTLFFSIALALAIGYGLDNFAYGFLIVGGIYLVFAMLVYFVQDKVVEGPILRSFSKMFFK
ncbi:MAG TPA: competence protein [Flavobacterium sp.]|nr:competence protein [Flavobacterium sp.]